MLHISNKMMLSSRARRYLSVVNRQRYLSKVVSLEEAIQELKDGDTVLFGGFGLCGIPEHLIHAIERKGTKKITAVSNDAGVQGDGLGVLVENGQVEKLHCSYVGEHKTLTKLFTSGKLEVHLTPQGTLAEKMRSGGAGIPAFYTPTGYGTVVQSGGFPVKYNTDGTIAKYSKSKEIKEFNGKPYVLEESLTGDFACIKAWKADTSGNLIFKSTARNFNCDMAKAARTTIVEVEEIVETGVLLPDEIHLPGIYVDKVVLGKKYTKKIEKRTVRTGNEKKIEEHPEEMNKRDLIAWRAAQELRNGMYVNLGIGVPTLVGNHIPAEIDVVLHSENGLLGIGPFPLAGTEDADLINAGKETISYLPGSAVFSSSDSFAMVRGRHIHVTILGALQVSSEGDLASWLIPGQSLKGIGGAMDLVAGCDRVIAATMHTDSKGSPKILRQCNFPLTGKGVVDMIITDLAVFSVDKRGRGGLTLQEYNPTTSIEELRKLTDAPFNVAENVKHMY